jgi:hypothetical protein
MINFGGLMREAVAVSVVRKAVGKPLEEYLRIFGLTMVNGQCKIWH